MARLASTTYIHQLETLFDAGSLTGQSDRQLLDRFNSAPEPEAQAAFSALVARHGPMVLRVCTHLLQDEHHAQDAFQAVFLVLARRAWSIHDPDKLANWLYGVALRTARCARKQADQRAQYPLPSAPQITHHTPDQDLLNREQADLLHQEIHRLPQHFRLPILLHYFEGLSIDEAATHLQVARGTIASRLNRAREKLKHNLTQRGFTLSIASLIPKPITAQLRDQTSHAALQFATGGTTTITTAALIATQVLKATLIPKLKLAGLLLCTLALTASGATILAQALSTPATQPAPPTENPEPAAPSTKPTKPAPGRMLVTGRVLDPTGKPLPGATVMVHARPKLRIRNLRGEYSTVLGSTKATPDGNFQLDCSRTSLAVHEEFAAFALAPGYGIGWLNLNPSAEQPTADIRLEPEQLIQFRLFDLKGQPANGVKLLITSIERSLPQGPYTLSRRFDGATFGLNESNDLAAWPKPVTTDPDGHFTLHGAGPGQKVGLTVTDDRFARQRIEVNTDQPSSPKTISMALQPAKIITGQITYADSGKPAPAAQIRVLASTARRPSGTTYFQSDANGRFHANPAPGDRFSISVFSPEGSPYLLAHQTIDWPKAAIEHKIDFTLPRGVLIQGKVTQAGTGKPIGGASVSFIPRVPVLGGFGESETKSDGSFTMAVKPTPGHLTVVAATDDYRLLNLSERMFTEGKPGGQPRYANAFIPCEPKSADQPLEINASLEPGLTINGHIIGPDGQPIDDTSIISHFAMRGLTPIYRYWRGDLCTHARNGYFELHGLDASTVTSVSFLDPKRRLGATVKVTGNMADTGPITVRLEPCGTASARLVDHNAKPIIGFRAGYMIAILLSTESSPDTTDKTRLLGEQDFVLRVDPINYQKEPTSDESGQVFFPALIPGTTYRITDRTARPGTSARKYFTVKPGETLDLGDILIEKPKQ